MTSHRIDSSLRHATPPAHLLTRRPLGPAEQTQRGLRRAGWGKGSPPPPPPRQRTSEDAPSSEPCRGGGGRRPHSSSGALHGLLWFSSAQGASEASRYRDSPLPGTALTPAGTQTRSPLRLEATLAAPGSSPCVVRPLVNAQLDSLGAGRSTPHTSPGWRRQQRDVAPGASAPPHESCL